MKQLKDYSKTMIVRVDAPGLQYDISAILKAFYPDREIRVLEPDSVVHDQDILTLPVYMDVHIPRESADKPNEVCLSGMAEEVPKDMLFSGETADTSKDGRGDDIDGESDGAWLLTFHAAKGLEFDRVILIGCNDGIIPSRRAQTCSATEEERRLFYVALTRSRQQIVIFTTRKSANKIMYPSRFIDEMGVDVLK